MAARSNPEHIEYRLRQKVGSEFNYVTDQHTRADVESENYFHNLAQRYLQTGDLVHAIVKHLDGSMSKTVFEVTSVEREATVVVRILPWRNLGDPYPWDRSTPAKVEDKTPPKKAA